MRSRLEQRIAILKALQERSLKASHITYRTRVDCTMLNPLLNQLIKDGFIQILPPIKKASGKIIGKTRPQQTYALTEKGRNLLKVWINITAIANE